jgi:hypothetical protein
MRRGVALVCALALAGCSGGQGHKPSAATEAGAGALTAWQVAAQRFQSEMRQCGGHISPIRGSWAACINGEHRRYARATASTLLALRAVSGAGPACKQSRAVAIGIVTHLGEAWDRAWLAWGRAIRAVDENRAYGGPAPIALNDRADHQTTVNTRLVPGLTSAMRRSCD